MKQGNDMVRLLFWEDRLTRRTNGRGEAGAAVWLRDAEMQLGLSREMGSTVGGCEVYLGPEPAGCDRGLPWAGRRRKR